jgi:hypothetical protein
VLIAEAMKETEDDFFVAMTDMHAFDVSGVGQWETGEAIGEEAEGGAIHCFAGALEEDG